MCYGTVKFNTDSQSYIVQLQDLTPTRRDQQPLHIINYSFIHNYLLIRLGSRGHVLLKGFSMYFVKLIMHTQTHRNIHYRKRVLP